MQNSFHFDEIFRRYLWLRQDEFQGKKVLELGSGTALPGLLTAKIGADQVTLSDDAWQVNTIKNILEAVKINNLQEPKIQVKGLTWGDYTEELFELTNLDFIIGSDLFFDPEVFEPLLITIAWLLEHNPQVLIAVQERSSDWCLEEHLLKWKLKCSYIYPKDFLQGTGLEDQLDRQTYNFHLENISRIEITYCSKSSFFVQKFNFDFPRKLSIFWGGEKLVKMLWFWTF